MIDRKKLIKAIEYHNAGKCIIDGILCPYWEYENCDGQLESDALELLKEQEAVEPFSDDDSGYWCGSCHEDIVWHQKFCSNCGRPVLWEGDSG